MRQNCSVEKKKRGEKNYFLRTWQAGTAIGTRALALAVTSRTLLALCRRSCQLRVRARTTFVTIGCSSCHCEWRVLASRAWFAKGYVIGGTGVTPVPGVAF